MTKGSADTVPPDVMNDPDNIGPDYPGLYHVLGCLMRQYEMWLDLIMRMIYESNNHRNARKG